MDISGIESGGPPGFECTQLDLGGFLATIVLKIGPQLISIGDLISTSANVLGGVHTGKPKTDKEGTLIEFNSQISIFGYSLDAQAKCCQSSGLFLKH